MTPYEAAIYTRQRLNLPPSEIPRLITYIDTALENLARSVAHDRVRRPLLITNRATVTSTLTNTLDQYYSSISTIQSSYGVMKELMQFGTVLFNYGSTTFTDNEIDTGTDAIQVLSHGLRTGLRVRLTTSGALPTGLATATDYYIIVYDDNNVQLASSRANAFAGTEIALAADGSGTHTITPYEYDTVQWVANGDYLPVTPDRVYVYGWLVDDRIYLSGVTNGTLSYSVPFVPTLSTLPARLEDDFIDEMVKVATMQMDAGA